MQVSKSHASDHDEGTGEISVSNAEVTLGDLVVIEGASVRLSNCVSRSELALMSVKLAWSDPRNLEAMCKDVPAMGLKSMRELQEMLSRHIGQRGTEVTGNPVEEPAQSGITDKETARQLKARIVQAFAGITASDMITTLGASVRLAHGIEASPFRDAPMGTLFDDWKSARSDFLNQKNFGRASFFELTQVCSQMVEGFLQSSGCPEEGCQLISSLVFAESMPPSEKIPSLIEATSALGIFDFSYLTSQDLLAPDIIVSQLLEGLAPRPRDILTRRFGLDGVPPETLEQIATDYSVTRERIRQLESKALKELAAAARFVPLQETFTHYSQEIWAQLAGPKGYVTSEHIARPAAFSPQVRLLLQLADMSPSALLDLVASRWGNGWCTKGAGTADLDALSSLLQKAVNGKQLPRPLDLDVFQKHADLIPLLSGLEGGTDVQEGYLLGSGSSRRSDLKAVTIHKMIGSDAVAVDLIDLADALQSHWEGQGISSRYLAMIMTRYPHLFIESDDGQWFAVGGRRNEDMIVVKPLARARASDPHEEIDGVAGFLKDLLLSVGPTRLTNLVELAEASFPEDRSRASIGPTLIMHRDVFIRVLPGVYGLPSRLPSGEDIIQQRPPYLLNEEQARLYALGRQAGEPWGTFPLWTPSSEAALCEWARDNASEPVFLSLLAVASFDAWPLDISTRRQWESLARQHDGRFFLHFEPRDEVGYALPRLDRLLAACLETRASGQFNWMLGNRILNKQAASHLAAGLVVLMCSLGALRLEQNGHWQRPHYCGPKIEQLILLLSSELHANGRLDWQSPLGVRLLDEAEDSIGSWQGWVNRRLLAAMVLTARLPGEIGEDDDGDPMARAIGADIGDLEWIASDLPASPGPTETGSAFDYTAQEITSARILSIDEGKWSFEDDFSD